MDCTCYKVMQRVQHLRATQIFSYLNKLKFAANWLLYQSLPVSWQMTSSWRWGNWCESDHIKSKLCIEKMDKNLNWLFILFPHKLNVSSSKFNKLKLPVEAAFVVILPGPWQQPMPYLKDRTVTHYMKFGAVWTMYSVHNNVTKCQTEPCQFGWTIQWQLMVLINFVSSSTC